MTARASRPSDVGRRVAEAFREPAFDEVMAERILRAASSDQTASRRTPGRNRHVRFALVLAASATLVLAAVTWSSFGGAPRREPTAPRAQSGSAIALSSVYRLAPDPPRWQGARRQAEVSALGHSIASGGDAARSTGHVLLLATGVLSHPTRAGDPLMVRLTLSNLWGGTVSWDRFRFDLSVTTTFQPDPTAPGGIGLRSGGGALLLRPGESTTTVLSTPLTAGAWRIVGSYEGEPGGFSGMTPAITVVTPARQ